MKRQRFAKGDIVTRDGTPPHHDTEYEVQHVFRVDGDYMYELSEIGGDDTSSSEGYGVMLVERNSARD